MRDAYFFIMAKKNDNNNSKQDNFYALVKELLETQTATLIVVKENNVLLRENNALLRSVDNKLDKLLNCSKEKDLAKLWDGI